MHLAAATGLQDGMQARRQAALCQQRAAKDADERQPGGPRQWCRAGRCRRRAAGHVEQHVGGASRQCSDMICNLLLDLDVACTLRWVANNPICYRVLRNGIHLTSGVRARPLKLLTHVRTSAGWVSIRLLDTIP